MGSRSRKPALRRALRRKRRTTARCLVADALAVMTTTTATRSIQEEGMMRVTEKLASPQTDEAPNPLSYPLVCTLCSCIDCAAGHYAPALVDIRKAVETIDGPMYLPGTPYYCPVVLFHFDSGSFPVTDAATLAPGHPFPQSQVRFGKSATQRRDLEGILKFGPASVRHRASDAKL
jgi:hypothetical protein